MTNTANTTKNSPADASAIDRPAVTRTLNIVKHSVGELYADARRKTPYFANSKEEAEAKLSAALKALEGFAENLEAIKKR